MLRKYLAFCKNLFSSAKCYILDDSFFFFVQPKLRYSFSNSIRGDTFLLIFICIALCMGKKCAI